MELPLEVIDKICRNMSDNELFNFVQTYGHIYQSCVDILNRRKEEYNKFVQESFGPVFGYVNGIGEFYIKNANFNICKYCKSRNLNISQISTQDGFSLRLNCYNCQKKLWLSQLDVRPAINCSDLTKDELLTLAYSIGYRPESYNLNEYSKEEICQMLKKFFQNHDKLQIP